MITLNLLPDIKKEYIKAHKLRNSIITIAFIVSGVSVGFVVLGFSIVAGQRAFIARNENKITELTTTMVNIPDLDKVLTIQSQLGQLSDLHNKKPQAQRLFGLIRLVTPDTIDLNDVYVNYEDQTIEISGTTDSAKAVNVFVDTIKNTSFTSEAAEQGVQSLDLSEEPSELITETVVEQELESFPAFSEVVTEPLFSEEGVRFKVIFSFDNAIFNIANRIKFNVPTLITTQSETGRPTDLFSEVPEEGEGNN
jgi:Tfp pilus assembly protein PilN